MELQAIVYSNRDYLGKLSVINHGRTAQEFEISAKSDPGLGIADPPAGRYKLLDVKDVTEEHREVVAAYGESVIYFERMGGFPVASNCEGKFILAIYGGSDGDDLLPTDGGIRLSNDDLATLIDLIGDAKVSLSISEESVGLLGRFTHRKVSKRSPRKLRLSYHGNRRMRECYSDDDDLLFWIMMYMLWSDGGDLGDIDGGIDDGDAGDFDDGPIDDGGPVDDDVPPPDAVEPEPPLEGGYVPSAPAEETPVEAPVSASWIDPPKDPVIADPFKEDVAASAPSWEPAPTAPEPEPPAYSSPSTYESAGGTQY
jgi:hypothetical protein